MLMRTVITTLPIYKARRDQCYMRSMANGCVEFAPIYTPRHRLPSFQWIDDGDGATAVTAVYLVDREHVATDITTYFSALPALYTSDAGDDYFIYNGDTLNFPLDAGNYYLKIVMDSGHVYYSDHFIVDCVYKKFAMDFINNSFDTFTESNTVISSAIDAGAGAYADSTPEQEVYLGQAITVIVYVTGTDAVFSLVSATLGVISNVATAVAGLNELTLTTTAAADDCFVRVSSVGAANFSTSEILVHTQYSEKWVTLSFSNCCNLGDLLYEDDFRQTLWIKSDNVEQAYPYVERGLENGEGRFIPTFRRQDKTYIIKTLTVSQMLVDALHRLKLHDVVTFIDQVGDAWGVETVDVEHEWLNDKYYAQANIVIDLGEAIVAVGCC